MEVEPDWFFVAKERGESEDDPSFIVRSSRLDPGLLVGEHLIGWINDGLLQSPLMIIPIQLPEMIVLAVDTDGRQAGHGSETFAVLTEPPIDGELLVQGKIDGRPVGRPLTLDLDAHGEARVLFDVPSTVGAWTVEATVDELLTAESSPIDVSLRGPLELAVVAELPDALSGDAVRAAEPPQRAVSERPGCASLHLLAYHPDPPPNDTGLVDSNLVSLAGALSLSDAGLASLPLSLTSAELVSIEVEHDELPSTRYELSLLPLRPSTLSKVLEGADAEVGVLGTPLSSIEYELLTSELLPPTVPAGIGAPEIALVARPRGDGVELPCGTPVDDERIACDPQDVDPELDGGCFITQDFPTPIFGRNTLPLSPGVCWSGELELELWMRPWLEATDACIGEWPLAPWTRISSSTARYVPAAD